jgi:hypothetical protein
VARRRRRTFVLVVAGVFGAGVGGAVLVSAATNGSITGCVNNQPNQANLRITSDTSGFAGTGCNSFEHAITFNAAGPPGPAGPAGPAGAQGPTGPTGSAGVPGSGGGTSNSPAKTPAVNFIAMTSFPMPGRHFVEAEIDCPKGDVAEGGTAAMISPLGVAPAVGNAGGGPGIGSPIGHPAVGWVGEATNSSLQAASLKLSVICAGSDLNAANVTRRPILSRKLRKTKAG